MPRQIWHIAKDIRDHWPKMSPYAEPYVKAMFGLSTIHDSFAYDTADDIVLRFLCNAQTWRGPDARRIKAELKQLLKEKN